MGKLQLQRKNEGLKSLKVAHLSSQEKIATSSMIRTYKKSNKPQTIITELIAILLIFNKLKFNLHLIITTKFFLRGFYIVNSTTKLLSYHAKNVKNGKND